MYLRSIYLSTTQLPSNYVFPDRALRGGWLKQEEENLARYLATHLQPDATGASIWNAYHVEVSQTLLRSHLSDPEFSKPLTNAERVVFRPLLFSQHPSRSARAYDQHYRDRKKSYFDSRIAKLRKDADGSPGVDEQSDEEEKSIVPFSSVTPSFLPFPPLSLDDEK